MNTTPHTTNDTPNISPYPAPRIMRREKRLPMPDVLGILLAMILFCALLSSLFFINQSLRLDEAQSLWQSGHSPVGIIKLIAEDVHVPLFPQLLHAWRLAFGSDIETARAFSLTLYLLCIPTIYILGLRLYSQRVGLFAAALLTLSPFINWYGNEIRMYSLFLLLTIFNQYFYAFLMRQQTRYLWLGYTLTAIAGMYAHYFFVFNLIGQAIFFFLRRRAFGPHAFRSFVISAAVVAAAILPWVWYVLHLGRAVNQEPLLITPTTVDLFNAFAQFFFGFQTDTINTVILALWPLGVIVAFFTLKDTFAMEKETEYLIISIITSFTLAFGFSVLVSPVFLSRYLIFTTPALFLLTAHISMRYAPAVARLALLGGMVAMLFVQVTSVQTPVKEEYRAAVAYVNARVAPSDVVIVSAPFTIYPVEYYYTGDAPLVTLPFWNQYAFGPIPVYTQDDMQQQVGTLAQSHQSAWVLLSYDQGYETNIRDHLDANYNRTLEKQFSIDLTLYHYTFRYDTPLSISVE